MATPMTSSQWVNQATKWGIKLDTTRHSDWATHNRNSVKAFGPVYGCVIHHTASTSQLGMVDYCYTGDPARNLPGPLALGVVTDDGICHMVGWGRANTQGNGDGDVLAAMQAGRPPSPPGPDDTDGNSCFYGFEFCAAGGSDKFTSKQFDTAVNIACAVLDFHNWQSSDVRASVIGHCHWTQRKPSDPTGSLNWNDYIAAVNARIGAEEEDMPTQQEVRDAVYDAIADYMKAFYSASGTGTAVWGTQKAVLAEEQQQTDALNRIADNIAALGTHLGSQQHGHHHPHREEAADEGTEAVSGEG